MSRKLLLVSILSLSLAAIGQTSAASNQDNGSSPGVQNPAAIPPSTGGNAWTGIGPAGGVLLSTPSLTFDSPQPTAGISDAGRAGISNNTPVNTGLQSTFTPSSMAYTYAPATNAVSTAPAAGSPATEAVSSARMNDFGPSFFVNSPGAPPAAAGRSLAEVAEMYRAQKSTHALRTYTNADVPRENAGMLNNITMASNMPPAVGQSSKPRPAAANPNQSQASSQQQPPSSETSASNNPRPTEAEQEGSTSRLPASSTILPLLGLLGVASAGIGIWYRRRGRSF